MKKNSTVDYINIFDYYLHIELLFKYGDFMENNNKNILIKPVTDTSVLVSIFVNVFNKDPWNENWNSEYARKNLYDLENTPQFFGLVASYNNVAVGAILGNIKYFGTTKTYYIEHFFVDKKYRHLGIGSSLYNSAIKELKEKGITGAFFTTKKDSDAYHFYIRQGTVDLTDSSVMYHRF